MEIQTLTVVYDEMGAPSKEWVTAGAAWAAVEPESGRNIGRQLQCKLKPPSGDDALPTRDNTAPPLT